MNPLLQKIIAGDPYRKTRFHDEKGNLMTIGQLRYVPLNLFVFIRTKLINQYPVLPWIPFIVIKYFKKIISKDWVMVEFGSGMSTLWYASKVKFIYSIEHDQGWYRRISGEIERRNLKNVKYELRPLDKYSQLDDLPDQSLDFVVVDGWARSDCLLASLDKLKKGGYLYLDNSDKDMTIEHGDMRKCEEILREQVSARNGQLLEFTGLTANMFNTNQGILAKL